MKTLMFCFEINWRVVTDCSPDVAMSCSVLEWTVPVLSAALILYLEKILFWDGISSARTSSTRFENCDSVTSGRRHNACMNYFGTWECPNSLPRRCLR
jgi:hypothetical protein